MELTPEEKNKIYEEEKVRIEALATIKEEEKQKKRKQEARILRSCLKIIAVIAISWILYYPTKAVLSSILLSKEDLDQVTEIEWLNEKIDRDKGALWDVGMKDASRNISYRSYPGAYDNVRTLSFFGPLVIVSLGFWYISRAAKKESKSKKGRG